jgi:CO/xanthine dehydrogenase Mo-binding subunit
MRTERPVKFCYSRADEMRISSTRAAWRIYLKDGVMNDGRIVARKIASYEDAGAYLRFSSYGAMKQSTHYPGPYSIPNVWADVHCVFTNRTPSSAMRGFGVMPASFALELQMNRIAATLGMDPWRLRLLNAYRNGDMRAHRQPVHDAALVETIQVAARLADHALPENFNGMTSWDREAG